MNYNFSILIILISLLIILLYSKKNVESFSNIKLSTKIKNWDNLKFTEKLQIFNLKKTKQNFFYADKYKVKDYINGLNIKDLHVAKNLDTIDINKQNININSLPDNCVIKTNNGSGDIIVIKNKQITHMIARGRKLKNNINNYNKWKKISLKPHITKYEKHYKLIEPKIYIEEYLGDNINDFKFFCIQGKFQFCQMEIFGSIYSKCLNFYDKNFNLLNMYKEGYPNCKKKFEKPDKYKQMITIAEQISKPFEFVRVDLYNIQGKIYFGEMTFAPSGAQKKFLPDINEINLGKIWN